jgi:hypothetical protein
MTVVVKGTGSGAVVCQRFSNIDPRRFGEFNSKGQFSGSVNKPGVGLCRPVSNRGTCVDAAAIAQNVTARPDKNPMLDERGRLL